MPLTSSKKRSADGGRKCVLTHTHVCVRTYLTILLRVDKFFEEGQGLGVERAAHESLSNIKHQVAEFVGIAGQDFLTEFLDEKGN